MIIDRHLCFPWMVYGECDCTVSMNFYVKALVTADEFLVKDIYAIQCSGFQFNDGRAPLPWSQHTQRCDQFAAAFKVCYREDIGELQAEVQDKASEVLGPECWREIAKPVMPVGSLDYLEW